MPSTPGHPTSPCRYCGMPVAHSHDPETGTWYVNADGGDGTGAHWECMSPNLDGEWVVRTTQQALTPPVVVERRYVHRQRAREIAATIRSNNPRALPCGTHLDIIVTRERTNA